MTKQRPASLNGSLLVKKGQAKPSVVPTTDPVEKKVSRFPDPETVSDAPLLATPPIGELYGNKTPEPAEPDPPATARAQIEPPSSTQEAATTPITAPTATPEDRPTADFDTDDEKPEPRVVFLLPRISGRLVLSLFLVALMGVSAWYLMGNPEDSGTQRLASVGSSEEAVPPTSIEGDVAASAISPPPSGAVTTATLPPPSKTKPASPASEGPAPVPEKKPIVQKVSTGSGAQYAIQLLATKSTEAGRTAWNQISAKHDAQLSDLSLDMQTVTLQGRGKFVRVRAGPIGDKQAAVNRCKALSAAGQDCLVVKF